jgi:hypothetical protein
MVGVAARERRVPQSLQRELRASRVGRRWERLFHRHEAELSMLVAVHSDVRHHLGRAVTCLSGGDAERPVDDGTLAAVSEVLEDLCRLGGMELRRTSAMLLDELTFVHGRSLHDLLADR